MKIYLIRHGETKMNRQKRFYGELDVPISSTGRVQAETLKQKLAFLSKDLSVYTSGLQRSIVTAEIVFPHKKLIKDHRCNEKSFGLWEGLTAQEIEEAFPKEWWAWINAPFSYTPPEAERFADFAKRVQEAFESLVANQQDSVLVCHLGVLRVLLHTLFPEKVFWEIDVCQGCYTVLEHDDAKWQMLSCNV